MGLPGQYRPTEFAAWTRPQWVIVSGGFRADLLRLEMIYGITSARPISTAAAGAVSVRIEANGSLAVSRYLSEAKD